MNTIAEQWENFEKMVMPVGASSIQRREMRLAFYAGCQTMLKFNYLIGGESVSEDAGIAMLENWNDECHRFFKQIDNGEA